MIFNSSSKSNDEPQRLQILTIFHDECAELITGGLLLADIGFDLPLASTTSGLSSCARFEFLRRFKLPSIDNGWIFFHIVTI